MPKTRVDDELDPNDPDGVDLRDDGPVSPLDFTDVPDDLNFGDGYIDDDVDIDDDLNTPIPVAIGGFKFHLNRPADSALAIRAAELYAAPTFMEQYLAMMAVLATSLDHAGMQLVRQRALGTRVPGKRFDDEIIGKMVKVIFEQWGGGRELPDLKPRDQDKPVLPPKTPQNRNQRRAAERQRA